MALGPYLSDKGCFIYSASDTLQKNQVLLYGLNPGQNPEECHPSNPLLSDSIADFAGDQPNLIKTERWLKPPHQRQHGVDYPEGTAPYQQQITCLLNFLEHPDALVTNLIFLQTRDSNELRKLLQGEKGERIQCACWTVHQHILNITKPRAIIAIGIGTFERLCRLLGGSDQVPEPFPSGCRGWKCRSTSRHWDERKISIIGIPHLSWYRINRYNDACSWVKKKVTESLR